MSDELKLTLDPDTADSFRRFLDTERLAGRYTLDRHGMLAVPDHHPLFSKLKQYIDTEQGGLKVLELDMHGATATFSIVPRVRIDKSGRIGGSIGVGFTLKY